METSIELSLKWNGMWKKKAYSSPPVDTLNGFYDSICGKCSAFVSKMESSKSE